MRPGTSDGISRSHHRISTCLLALCWMGGLFSGAAVCLGAGDSLLPLMRSAAFSAVSIVDLLLVSLIPFLISAFAVSIFPPALLPVCFGKAFLISFAAAGLTLTFGNGGWLFAVLVLFGSVALLPLLWIFWLSLLSDRQGWLLYLAVLAGIMLIVSVDYRIISPFAAHLIEIQKGILG